MLLKAVFGLMALASGGVTAWGTREFNWFEETLVGLGLTILLLVAGILVPVRSEKRMRSEEDEPLTSGTMEERLRVMEGRMVNQERLSTASGPMLSSGADTHLPNREGPCFF